MSLQATAIVCCLLALVFALIGASEESAGHKPAWLFMMAFVMAVAGAAMGAVHVLS